MAVQHFTKRKPTDEKPKTGVKIQNTLCGHDVDEVRDAIYKCCGIIPAICVKLNIPPKQRCNIYHMIRTNPELKDDIVKAREQMVGKAEEKMLALVDSKDERLAYEACKFILDRLGKYNGWSKQTSTMAIELDNAEQSLDNKQAKIRAIFNLGDEDENNINITINNQQDEIITGDVIEIDNMEEEDE